MADAAARIAAAVRVAEDEVFAKAGFKSSAPRGLNTSEAAESFTLLWRALGEGAERRRTSVRITPTKPEDIIQEAVRLNVFVKQTTDHPRCSKDCKWENFNAGYGYQHPTLGQRYRATGDVFVCNYSGRVHVCNETDCVPYLQNSHGTYVCQVSGRTRGSAVAVADAHADKATIQAADALTTSLTSGRQPMTGRFGRPIVGAKRKTTDPTTDAAATDATDVEGGSVVSSTSGTTVTTTTDVVNVNSQAFAAGSAAEKYSKTIGDGERVVFGSDLIRFHICTLSDQSQRSAHQWCRAVLFSTDVQRIHSSNLAEAEKQFEDTVAKYSAYFDLDPSYYAMLVFQACMKTYSPHVDRVLWSTVMRRTDSEEVIRYFATALLYVWKIVECTPKRCEHQTAPSAGGGPTGSAGARATLVDEPATTARSKSSFHIDKCALSILYMLADGHAQNVYHDVVTNRIVPEEDALRLASEVLADGRPRLKRERVEFVPAHRFLQSALPAQSQVRRIDFTNVLLKGNNSTRTPQAQMATANASKFNPSMVTFTGQLREAFRSLCNARHALSLEQLKQYRLAHHLTIRDFCKVGEASIVSECQWVPTVDNPATRSNG